MTVRRISHERRFNNIGGLALLDDFALFICFSSPQTFIFTSTTLNYFRAPFAEHFSIDSRNTARLQTASQLRYLFRGPEWMPVCVRMLLKHRPPDAALRKYDRTILNFGYFVLKTFE
jgi:hypothetical protein